MRMKKKISGVFACDGTVRQRFDKIEFVVKEWDNCGEPVIVTNFYAPDDDADPIDCCVLYDEEQEALLDLLYGYVEWLKTGKECDFIFNTTTEYEGREDHRLCWLNTFYDDNDDEKLAIYIFNTEGDKILELLISDRYVEKLFKAIQKCASYYEY